MKLELHGLSVRYGRGRNLMTAVDGIDLAVPAGATVGLVGESGCGKSTVARAVVGLVPTSGGRILLDGVDVTANRVRNRPEFRRRVQMVFQDPYASLNPRMSIQAILKEAAARADGSRPRRAPAEMAELVGLPATVLGRYPHQLSGGQRQRIAIARALAVNPGVIVLDEVTSALDVSVQGSVLNLLRDLQREMNVSYVFISHDLSTVRYMSDTVSVMYLGRIVETARTEDLFARPQHPYTTGLIDSVPRLHAPRTTAPLAGDLPDPRRPPTGCRLSPRCPVGPLHRPDREICHTTDPQSIAAQKVHEAACHFAVDAAHAVVPAP
ncbi:MAG: peptide/nickel transport system ATP-binding protein [Pseudonocardiales bacterium]|nr:peptide/nickel transport system ATP-binding protein [Pseudonocardiales bacterium]